MKLELGLVVIAGLFAYNNADTCVVCESTYTNGLSSAADDTAKCTLLKGYLTCLETGTSPGCPLTTAQAAKILSDFLSFTGCTLTDSCTCQKDYWGTDSSSSPGDCTAGKLRASCLKTKEAVGCDGSTTVVALATTTETIITNLAGCTVTNTACGCELAYAKADISTNALKCSEAKTYIGCLKDKTGTGCDSTSTVSALITAAEGTITGLTTSVCSAIVGTPCGCESTFGKADRSDNTKLCAETKKLGGCLKTLTGTACAGATVTSLVTGIESSITSISGCAAVTNTACGCELAYAKADISTNALKCSEAKTYIGCLKDKTDTGCDSTSTVSALITAAEGTITGLTTSVCSAIVGTPCGCESTFGKADRSDNTKLCAETKKLGSCLKTLTGTACAGVTVTALVSSIESSITSISGCTAVTNTACGCELAYAKADISTDALKCSEAKKYIGCLKDKSGTGCDSTSTVSALITAAEGTITGLTTAVCSAITSTACECEATYGKADRSSDVTKCTETKAYVNCLKDKTGTGCDATTTVAALATAAESTINAITGTPCTLVNTTCYCDVQYAKSDISDNTKKCTALKNLASCLLGKTGTGCDGSTTLRSLASATSSSITTLGATVCPKTSNCDCEIAYVMADISDNTKKCTETKTLSTCIDESLNDGCGTMATRASIGSKAQEAFTDIGSTACPITDACQCQINFNKADVSTNTNKCSAANALSTCVGAITATTQAACDGTTLKEVLKTNVSAPFITSFCSTGVRVDSSSMASLLLLVLLLPLVTAFF
ncbi:serine-rich adhesin for platelets-like [Haliotis cracherodii]|uniref:serine-rich adhesin for platelets-like n=1 Tax=Haliotis cracherodii TaxID=6455 RepID=UPI0039E8C791